MTVLNNHPAAQGLCLHCNKPVYENNGVLFHETDGNQYCDFKGFPTDFKAELQTKEEPKNNASPASETNKAQNG